MIGRLQQAPSGTPRALSAAVRGAARFDRSLVSLEGGLLAAIPVTAVLGGGIATGNPVAGVTMGAGAMLVGIAWRLIGGLLVSLGNRGGVLGTQAVLAVIVFGRFSEPAPAALGLAGLVLAGGAAQVAFLTVIRWPTPLRAQRAATACASSWRRSMP